MTMDITYCDSPIDVMYLIHNALRAEATEVTHRARQLGTANTLAAFAQALHQWASTLEEHARIEDTYMTPLLPARPVIQDNEAEHQRLTALFRALASPLQAIPPQMPLTPRLQRQVLGHVITLGVEHDDHLEREEDLVLPLVRQRLSEAQQCALVWRLLCAGGSQEAGTIGPWIMAALTTAEWPRFSPVGKRCNPSCLHRVQRRWRSRRQRRCAAVHKWVRLPLAPCPR